MAKIIIENAEVTSVMKTGTGFRCQTQYKTKNNQVITEKFVVWAPSATISVGSVVNVSGNLTLKQEEFTNDSGEVIKYTAVHVNQPNVTFGATPAESVAQVFPAATPMNEEAPF